MDIEVLKKKISSFKTKGGYLKNISDDLLMEILDAWECWEGLSRSFYTAIGTDYRKMASLMGRAKRLKQEGYISSEFKEIGLESVRPLRKGRITLLNWSGTMEK